MMNNSIAYYASAGYET